MPAAGGSALTRRTSITFAAVAGAAALAVVATAAYFGIRAVSGELGFVLTLPWSDPGDMTAARTPLVRAVAQNDVGAVLALLADGADPNRHEPDEPPALLVAVRHQRPALVRVLVEAGAFADARDGPEPFDPAAGSSALLLAASAADRESCEALLAAGADPNARAQTGDTPLTTAAACGGTPRLVRALLAAGADPNAANREGVTPLLAAARQGYVDLVPVLLAAGVDARRDGGPALVAALAEGHLELASQIAAAGADLGYRDTEGDSVPVLLGRTDGAAAGIAHFAKLGGDVNALGRDRVHAVAVARMSGNPENEAALLAAGGDESLGRPPSIHGHAERANVDAILKQRGERSGRLWLRSQYVAKEEAGR